MPTRALFVSVFLLVTVGHAVGSAVSASVDPSADAEKLLESQDSAVATAAEAREESVPQTSLVAEGAGEEAEPYANDGDAMGSEAASDNEGEGKKKRPHRNKRASEDTLNMGFEGEDDEEEEITEKESRRKHKGKRGSENDGNLEMDSARRPVIQHKDVRKGDPNGKDATRYGFLLVLAVWGALIYQVKQRPTSKVMSSWIQWLENVVMIPSSSSSSRSFPYFPSFVDMLSRNSTR